MMRYLDVCENKETVGKTTYGFGTYLFQNYGMEICCECGVVIGYDTGRNSGYFAKITANVLSSMGVKVYLHAHARPTPQLCFSVKFWGAVAGICVTTDNQLKTKNLYKIFDSAGCPLEQCQIEEIIAYVNATDISDEKIDFTGNNALISMADVTDNYINYVLQQSRYSDQKAKEALQVVYTPLHGTGNVTVQRALRMDGFTHVNSVAEQVGGDGSFPTVECPDPEDRQALEMAIAQAKRENADLIIATDPACERVGTVVQTEKEFQVLSADQMDALLMEFIRDNGSKGSKQAMDREKDAVVTALLLCEMAAFQKANRKR